MIISEQLAGTKSYSGSTFLFLFFTVEHRRRGCGRELPWKQSRIFIAIVERIRDSRSVRTRRRSELAERSTLRVARESRGTSKGRRKHCFEKHSPFREKFSNAAPHCAKPSHRLTLPPPAAAVEHAAEHAPDSELSSPFGANTGARPPVIALFRVFFAGRPRRAERETRRD